ncbi:MAG: integration host factor subunit beta [Solimonas sp.]
MTKSELIEQLAAKQTHLMHKDVELAVKLVLDQISNALARDERVEIRGFGSFALHHRPSRVGRNPKTGEPVQIPPKRVPHFKPGKEMRERVNAIAAEEAAAAAAAATAAGVAGVAGIV